jgi:hypothetical protein
MNLSFGDDMMLLELVFFGERGGGGGGWEAAYDLMFILNFVQSG